MGGSESIVDEQIAEGSELFREVLCVLLFFGAEACVLQKDRFAVLHLSYGCLGIGSYDVVVSCELDFLAEELCQACSNRSK